MSAIISPCGTYRLRLDREIDIAGPTVAIGGVNPSTADATANDATIRKDIGFGRRLGWKRIIKFNKFAYRATDVRALATAENPTGPGNDEHIAAIMREADAVIFAWGPLTKLPRRLRGRWHTIWNMAQDLGVQPLCFGTAKDGHPLHTLMIPYTSELRPWSPPL